MQKHETPDSIRLGILLIKEQTTNKKIESRGNTMKHYYALEQTHGNISIWSQYGRPTLHVFNSKKERDIFVKEYEPCDLNHTIDVTTSEIAYKAYTKIRNGEKHFLKSVEFHN